MIELLRQIWNRVQDRLRARAGDAAFEAWLSDLRPLALERGICYLEGKSRLVCERAERLYQPLLEECLSSEIGTVVSISLVPAADALVPDHLDVGPENPIVDTSNRTAFLVLRSLIEERILPANLFLFYGPPGAGKTFLLRWWAQKHSVRPCQFDGGSLVRAFQVCLKERRVADLRRELMDPRPIVIDEIHRLTGHKRIQRELQSALAARESSAGPVLIASRWHPREIWNLDESFQSMLQSGFVTEIDHPGPEARLRYLRALEGAPSRNGRAADIEGMAQQVRGSYQDLRRAWAVERETVKLPSRYLRLIDPRSSFDRLRDRVADRLGVAAEDIVGKSQGRRVSFARQVLSYLCVQEGLSRAEVGRFLGGRSRAAISYATKTLEKRMAESPEVRAQVEELL